MCIYNSIHFHTKQPECEWMYKIPFFFGTLKHWHKISSTLTWLYTRQSIICTVFDLSQFDECYEDVAVATDIAVYSHYNVDCRSFQYHTRKDESSPSLGFFFSRQATDSFICNIRRSVSTPVSRITMLDIFLILINFNATTRTEKELPW